MATYDFDFQRYVDRNNARQGVAVDGERPEFGDYAFSGDLRVLRRLNKMKPVHIVAEATVRFWKSVQRNELLGQAVKVTRRQFPEIHDATVDCAHALDAGGVVIAPGEHLDQGTPARMLAEPLIEDSLARIGFLNSLRHRSFAGRLLASKEGRAIKKDKRKGRVRRAAVERFVLPNHAPRWAMLGAVKALKPARVLLVHGKIKAQNALERALRESGYEGEVIIPEDGVPISLA